VPIGFLLYFFFACMLESLFQYHLNSIIIVSADLDKYYIVSTSATPSVVEQLKSKIRKIQIAGHNGPSKARCMGRKKRKREKKEEN